MKGGKEKDALIHALWAQVQSLTARVAALKRSSTNRRKTLTFRACRHRKGRNRTSRRRPSVSVRARATWVAKGGGRPLACDPDERVTAKPSRLRTLPGRADRRRSGAARSLRQDRPASGYAPW